MKAVLFLLPSSLQKNEEKNKFSCSIPHKTLQIIMVSTFRLIVGEPSGNVNLVYTEGMKAPLSCLFDRPEVKPCT